MVVWALFDSGNGCYTQAAIGATPIIGHKSGRLNNTHWMLFVKGANYIGDDTK